MSSDQPTRWVMLLGSADKPESYIFEGTEENAEKQRHINAVEENLTCLKRPALPDETEDSLDPCWNHPGFENVHQYQCRCPQCA